MSLHDDESANSEACPRCRVKAKRKNPGFQGLEDLTFVRGLIFVFGALPQYIKLMAMKGVTRSQIWCNMYLIEIIVLEIVISTRDWASPRRVLASSRKWKESARPDEEQPLTVPHPAGRSTSAREHCTQSQNMSAFDGTNVDLQQPVPELLGFSQTDGFSLMNGIFWTIAMLSQIVLLSWILNALDNVLRRHPGRYDDLVIYDAGVGAWIWTIFMSFISLTLPGGICILLGFIFLCVLNGFSDADQKKMVQNHTLVLICSLIFFCVFFIGLHFGIRAMLETYLGRYIAQRFSEWAVDFAILFGIFVAFTIVTYFILWFSPWLRLKIIHLKFKEDTDWNDWDPEIVSGSFVWAMFAFSTIFSLLYYVLCFDPTSTSKPKWTEIFG
jgi:hypothetical protein